jgi:tetratricopeptide (TPR) repeat protein
LNDAILALRKSIAVDDRNANAHKILGLVYAQANRIRPAQSELERAAQLAPADAETHYYLGRVYYTRTNLTGAVGAFERALSLQPESDRVLDNFGLTLAGLGRAQEAETAYRRAIEISTRRGQPAKWPHLNLADLLVKQNRPADAEPLLRRALELDPNWAKAHFALGKVLLSLDRKDDALAAVQRAVALDPEFADAHYKLAQLYRLRGETDKANAELRLFERTRSIPLNVPAEEPEP